MTKRNKRLRLTGSSRKRCASRRLINKRGSVGNAWRSESSKFARKRRNLRDSKLKKKPRQPSKNSRDRSDKESSREEWLISRKSWNELLSSKKRKRLRNNARKSSNKLAFKHTMTD